VFLNQTARVLYNLFISKRFIVDSLVKSHFVSDIESALAEKKIHDEPGVKNCKLFEGVTPSSCNLARGIMNPKIAFGANKIRLFTNSSLLFPKTK